MNGEGKMKKNFLFLALILICLFTLTSCKVADEGLSGGGGGSIFSKSSDFSEEDNKLLGISAWQYKLVSANCQHDGDSGQVVCSRYDTGDTTYLQNLVSSFEAQDWEYVDCITTGTNGNLVQTFMFRKAAETE